MVMKRIVALGLVFALGHSAVAFAEGSLLSAGARHLQQTARLAPAPNVPVVGRTLAANAAAQQGGASLQSSGLRRRTKLMIGLALAAGFAGSVLAIDSRVENNTPSSLGTRQD